MVPNLTAAPKRMDRRKARTRAALLGAATVFLSEGRSGVSIQEITDAADVGFGSFYNHFESKAELFDEAVALTLDQHAAFITAVSEGVDDPAERFAIGIRTSGRLQRVVPEMVKVLLHHGTGVLMRDQGMAPMARADIRAGIDSGRFVLRDPELAFMITGGALLGLLQMLDADPIADAAVASDRLAESLLRMFGLTPKQAERLAFKALPEPDAELT